MGRLGRARVGAWVDAWVHWGGAWIVLAAIEAIIMGLIWGLLCGVFYKVRGGGGCIMEQSSLVYMVS